MTQGLPTPEARMAVKDGTLIPETGDAYEPLHVDRFMDFEDFLNFGDEEERWELVGGLPAVPQLRGLGLGRMATHLQFMLKEALDGQGSAFDVWGYGAMVRIDDFNALLPSVLVEPRPEPRREWLICDPVLVIEASWGVGPDRPVLHERRDRYMTPGRTPPIQEYLAVIDSGPVPEKDEGRPPMNFVPFAGRMYTATSRSSWLRSG